MPQAASDPGLSSTGSCPCWLFFRHSLLLSPVCSGCGLSLLLSGRLWCYACSFALAWVEHGGTFYRMWPRPWWFFFKLTFLLIVTQRHGRLGVFGGRLVCHRPFLYRFKVTWSFSEIAWTGRVVTFVLSSSRCPIMLATPSIGLSGGSPSLPDLC